MGSWDEASEAWKARNGAGWAKVRKEVLDRDKQCQHRDQYDRLCIETTDLQVDHIDRFGGNDPSNLTTLCSWHHRQRTGQQASAARKSKGGYKTSRHPGEKHPGIKD